VPSDVPILWLCDDEKAARKSGQPIGTQEESRSAQCPKYPSTSVYGQEFKIIVAGLLLLVKKIENVPDNIPAENLLLSVTSPL
jgi:hypothetical protein